MHVKLKKDRLEEVRQRLAQTEMLNQQLNKNIAFVEESGSVVKEELKLEAQNEVLLKYTFTPVIHIYFYGIWSCYSVIILCQLLDIQNDLCKTVYPCITRSFKKF